MIERIRTGLANMRILRDEIGKERGAFDMSRVSHDCGSPACFMGHIRVILGGNTRVPLDTDGYMGFTGWPRKWLDPMFSNTPGSELGIASWPSYQSEIADIFYLARLDSLIVYYARKEAVLHAQQLLHRKKDGTTFTTHKKWQEIPVGEQRSAVSV